jgi:hypothetical protein
MSILGIGALSVGGLVVEGAMLVVQNMILFGSFAKQVRVLFELS